MTGIMQMFVGGKAGGGFIEATGGTVTDYNGYRIHRFTGSSDFVVTKAPAGATFELFIIGGGGGGNNGSSSGPGGAAGGAYWDTAFTASVGTFPVVIGAGGAGQLSGAGTANGNKGGDSSFNTSIVAYGGGAATYSTWSNLGGAGTWPTGVTYSDGGCGAGTYNGIDIATHPYWGDTTDRGRTVYNSTGAFAGSDQANYYGYPSGTGTSSSGGGGGGIGASGGNGDTTGGLYGGNGGAGMSFNWVGVTEWMGGGGGGGCGSLDVVAYGGSGVGGNGIGGATSGTSAVASTGSGGGGSGSGNGGSGSAGICIIKYPIA